MSRDAEERLRALGYVASSAQPSTVSGPNPAAVIDRWNRFEEALALSSAKRPEALPALKALAAASPDAPVFQKTYAQALKQAGQTAAALASYRGAVRRWPADATLLHDLAVAARDAANAARGPAAASLRDEAARADKASLVLAPGNALAHNGLGLLAVDEHRAGDAVKAFGEASTLDPKMRRTGQTSATRAAHPATPPAPSRHTAAPLAWMRTRPMPPTASASSWLKHTVKRRRLRGSNGRSRRIPTSSKRG